MNKKILFLAKIFRKECYEIIIYTYTGEERVVDFFNDSKNESTSLIKS